MDVDALELVCWIGLPVPKLRDLQRVDLAPSPAHGRDVGLGVGEQRVGIEREARYRRDRAGIDRAALHRVRVSRVSFSGPSGDVDELEFR